MNARYLFPALVSAGFLLVGCSTLAEPDLNAGLESTGSPATTDAATDAATETETATAAEAADVTKGTICGDVSMSNGELTRSVVALEDGADCAEIMSVFEDYLSPNPTGGPPRSTSAIWEAPNGWYCSKKILLNGDPDNNASLQPACGPSREHRLGVWMDKERIADLP
ncbi:hypothetical protein M3G18_08010 [Corynebacterium sp. p3-SID1145]|uniref:hypothetical protein n=1 Tax=unclassified Corynebacterium TaxID=2624378 RepID=UPI0021AAE07A|nr:MULTISPECIES: hypothetical protein [unclassified Corynebacterium]MCT1452844.1 hypothetical protein [Corynebacterium sp. p3-SID1145]MCT1461760.1 hypothetical protein [Corynebacterium sp. p3-SID1140]